MSIKVMTWVWDNSKHEGTELLAELSLADWANDDGVCWPNLTRIAKRTRVKTRQATNIIHQLEAAGTLYVQRGIGRISSRYLLIMGRSAAELVPVLVEYYRMDKTSAHALAVKLAEVQCSTPLVERCNPVQGRGAAGYTSEVQSGASKQPESKGRVRVPKTDPSLDPSLIPNVSATGVAGKWRELTTEEQIKAVIAGRNITVRDARDFASNIIAYGAYGMNKGNRFTSVTASEVIKDQCGDEPTAEQIAKLAMELHAMYVWWTDGKHGLSNPAGSPKIIGGLRDYRSHLAASTPKPAQPATPRVEMIEWVETWDGVKRPKLDREFSSDFKRSWMALAPAEATHG